MIAFDEETYTGRTDKIVIPVYDGHQEIEGDAIVIGDVHLPTTNWQIAEWVYLVGKSTGIKTLLIVGDLLNMDAFSYYPPVVPEISFETEKVAARRLLARYATHFDRIILSLGNHEKRYLKSKRGMLTMDELMSEITDENSRNNFVASPYPYMTVVSGGVDWHVTHPRNYSRIKGRLGDTLAQKHQTNVILLHQHHVSKSMDTFCRYVVIDGGGLFDAKKMAYVALEDGNNPVMCNGFVVLRGGIGHLITPYSAFTDLAKWGLK